MGNNVITYRINKNYTILVGVLSFRIDASSGHRWSHLEWQKDFQKSDVTGPPHLHSMLFGPDYLDDLNRWDDNLYCTVG